MFVCLFVCLFLCLLLSGIGRYTNLHALHGARMRACGLAAVDRLMYVLLYARSVELLCIKSCSDVDVI